ncbi:MAG: hypothetical protein E7319_05290 [Clostridiales bacterium]|nr:hypothetical protein [Clostridiales bacterium]
MAYLDKTGLKQFFDGLKRRFVLRDDLADHLTADAPGQALDARQGSVLKRLLDGKTVTLERTAVLAAEGWADDGQRYTQTVSIPGVTGAHTLVVSPAPACFEDYAAAGVYACAQMQDAVTFTAAALPHAELTVNLLAVTTGTASGGGGSSDGGSVESLTNEELEVLLQ